MRLIMKLRLFTVAREKEKEEAAVTLKTIKS